MAWFTGLVKSFHRVKSCPYFALFNKYCFSDLILQTWTVKKCLVCSWDICENLEWTHSFGKVKQLATMMTSSNGNIFRVTGPLWGEFTGPGEFPAQSPVMRSFDVFFDLRPNKRLSNCEAGDLRRHRGHYDVNVMTVMYMSCQSQSGVPQIPLSCYKVLSQQKKKSIILLSTATTL